MVVNLISSTGERKEIKVGGFRVFNDSKIKKLLNSGWSLASEKDAEIVSKRGIFN